MPATKTLRVLCCANNRITDASLVKKTTTKTKRPSLRLTKDKATEISITNEVISTKQREAPEALEVSQTAVKRTTLTPDLFRELGFSGALEDELENMLTLKRANRIYDSDDEDESPTKRHRTMADDDRDEFEQQQRPSVLDFRDRVFEDEVDGFQLQNWLQ